MELQLRVGGDRVLWKCGDATSALEITGEDLDGWAERYRRAVRVHNNDPLPELGREMLNAVGKGWSIGPWVQSGTPTLTVLSRPGAEAEELAEKLLLAPWELLADGNGFLAQNQSRLFTVARRIGDTGTLWTPERRDFALLFMAAAPEGESELDYEGEETAILDATRTVNSGAGRTYVVVEELGNRRAMGERLLYDGPFEAAHLSCHGTVHKELGPVLALESETGTIETATPVQLLEAFGAGRPPLVFVSGCLTAARQGDGLPPLPGGREDAGGAGNPELSESYVRRLVRADVANVVGWEGSVLDTDATAFASVFYGSLTRGEPVPTSAARARAELLHRNLVDRREGTDWHLARVYLGPAGGGPLTAPKGERRKRPANEGAFLDQENRIVPVAPREAFVGRRRELQRVLRAFAEEKPVLLHGMGNLGKSSLAARVAARMHGLTPVVLYERYDALGVFQALLGAVPADQREAIKNRWQEAVGNADANLGPALEAMLEGPLDAHPVLLIVDDLERVVLEKPSAGKAEIEPKPEYRETLAAILRAFAAAGTDSRLLITSRYRFALPDNGRDLAAGLVDIQLRPMSERERSKQWSAAARLEQRPDVERPEKPDDEAQKAAADRFNKVRLAAQEAAAGNPGLQDLLTRPLLAEPPEIEAVEAAIASVQRYRETGEVPEEENAAQEFFRRVSMQSYREALTGTQNTALQACTVFDEGIPIPHATLLAAIRAVGVSEADPALERLLTLGLLDDWGTFREHAHSAVNPLARPLVDTPPEADAHCIAAAAIEPLATAWRDEDGNFPRSSLGLEAARLALLGDAAPPVLDAATSAAANWLFHKHHAAEPALAFIRPALDRLSKADATPSVDFLRVAAKCAARVGDTALQDFCQETGLAAHSPHPQDRAFLLGESADRLVQRGALDTAMRRLEEATGIFERLGDARSKAVTMGKIGDILRARGQLDEALRIRQEEELPVYERLGDVHSKAVTMGQIADILRARGQLDEALRIRQEEELPVYERLGDVRSKAVTMGQIADILQARGQLDEALRIRTEEQLPVYERLGDVREKAMTMGNIADILQARGQLDEALRIRTEEQLPVYERLGDVRSKAMTMGNIADILQNRGQLDEALRIRQEEELPVYERLGDVRSKAVTMGFIADILQARGQFDEVLRIRQEEELPVYERLGDVRSKAVTMGSIADILRARGQLDEALRIRTEEQLPVYEGLGDVREKAVTMGNIADILQDRGELDEALAMNLERLEIVQALKHVDGIAHTRFSCAQIRLKRGDHERGEIQTIYEELQEAFDINKHLQRPDGVGAVGMLLAQVLAMGGLKDEALAVLQEARAGFELLKLSELVTQADQLTAMIRGNGD